MSVCYRGAQKGIYGVKGQHVLGMLKMSSLSSFVTGNSAVGFCKQGYHKLALAVSRLALG